jgi:hypothetical protein
MRCNIEWKTTEINVCQCSFGGVTYLISQEIHAEMNYKIPDSKNLHVTCNEKRWPP